jgi:signal transduction histidine kinase
MLSNAIKFTFQGSIRVKAELYQAIDIIDSSIYSFLKVSVIDTDIGMESEDLNHLFNLFGKLDDPTKINNEGIGLGLFISK